MNKLNRYERKAQKEMREFMNKLIQHFFLYRDRLIESNGMDAQMKLSELNLEWRKYCNKSKWKPKYNTRTKKYDTVYSMVPKVEAFYEYINELIDRHERTPEQMYNQLVSDVASLKVEV